MFCRMSGRRVNKDFKKPKFDCVKLKGNQVAKCRFGGGTLLHLNFNYTTMSILIMFSKCYK